MGSDDFISLDETNDSNNQREDNGRHNLKFDPSEADVISSTSHLNEVAPIRDCLEKYAENVKREEPSQIQTMGPEFGLLQKPVLEESVDLVESVTMVEQLEEVEPKYASDNGNAVSLNSAAADNSLIDESPIAGVKRARLTYVDQQPSVRVVYNSLTRESKRKLMELMQQWSEWHAQCDSSSKVSSKEALEHGEETYFPALHVGSEKTSAVSFWVDNPARKEDIKECMQFNNDLVPLYDRGFSLGATSLSSSSYPDSMVESLEASRCFNCGSYNHSLRECPKPRDNVAISTARKEHNSKRNSTPGSRGQARYYQKSPGKFDDLRAGVLGPETRESLGIGEFDPPPWLHRMRELGYPPGYLDVVDDKDQPSGITIFADDEETTKMEFEDGEIPEKGEPVPAEKKMTVEFPGINAPIPENADHRRWGVTTTTTSGFSGSNSFRNRTHQRPDRFPDSHHGHYTDDQRTDGPPGVDYRSGSAYSPRYSPYDRNPPPPGVPSSPNLGRSLSDRALRSPTIPYDSPPVHSPHSPYPYSSSMGRQSPAHQYHSPSQSLGHWAHETQYSATSDGSSQQAGRDRNDHHHHHSHRHHHDKRHDHRK